MAAGKANTFVVPYCKKRKPVTMRSTLSRYGDQEIQRATRLGLLIDIVLRKRSEVGERTEPAPSDGRKLAHLSYDIDRQSRWPNRVCSRPREVPIAPSMSSRYLTSGCGLS